MADLRVNVNTAVVVPVNILPLLDNTDFKAIEPAIVYDSAGMALTWNFVTPAGASTATAVTPTTGGAYDWGEPVANQGMYTIEIPASGGASINNNAEGCGWFTGVATGVLPWRGPTIEFATYATTDDVADAVLNRDMDLVDDTVARSPLNALRALRNKTSVLAGTLTVTKEDDATEAWTAAVTTNPAAEPITVVNPA